MCTTRTNISLYICINFFFHPLGPKLPRKVKSHSMVPLAKGQAILGGFYPGYPTIHDMISILYLTVIKRNCIITILDRKISVPRAEFVVIPISDKISGCITVGKQS